MSSPMSDAEARAFAQGAMKAEPRENKRDSVIAAVLDAGVTFWRDQRGAAFATVPRDGRLERYPVRSQAFRNIVRLVFGDANPVVVRGRGAEVMRPGSVPEQALQEAVGAFEAMALRGAEHHPAVRVCRHAGAVWIDLGRPDWSLIRAAPDGWRHVDTAEVPLVRPGGLLALPAPVASATALADLQALLNIEKVQDFMLATAWLVAALHPKGPFPVLALDGEQGSGKSTACRMLRRLVDPNVADMRAVPRDERDLVVAARNGRVVALDNVSYIEPSMADALCRVATGGGIGERMLYTNSEEHTVYVQNPVLLNGIPSLLARGDLADRAIAITLPAIPDHRRRPEEDIWASFDSAAPGILALLLEGLVLALRHAPGLKLSRLPRMADFAKIACASAPAFGWTVEAMLDAIEDNRAGAVAGVIEADAIASAVQAIAAEEQFWQGTATELLVRLNDRTSLERQREKDWPRDATRMSNRLRRVAPALRRAGVDMVLPEAGGRAGRLITIRQMAGKRSERSAHAIGNAGNTGNAVGVSDGHTPTRAADGWGGPL